MDEHTNINGRMQFRHKLSENYSVGKRKRVTKRANRASEGNGQGTSSQTLRVDLSLLISPDW